MSLASTARANRFAQALVKAGDLRPGFTERDVARAMARRLESATASMPLLRVGPGGAPYVEPHWLASLASVYHRAELAGRGEGPPVFATFSGPSQTGKSAFGEVAIATMIARNPSFFVATISYGSALTLPRSRRIREDVIDLGVALRDDSAAVEHWTTKAGGGLLATGVGGPVTGQPGLVLIDLDDPYQDEAEANSNAVRTKLEAFFDGVLLTRLGARTSIVVKFARWATNDLIGYIRSRNLPGWEHYTLPVIDEAGEPIPKIPGKDRAFYAKQRATMTASRWAALMMGEPRPREGRLFKGAPPTYATRPARFDCIRIGLDFAYSAKKSADHNAAVVVGKADRYYVLKVVRRQCESPAWREELKTLRAQFPAASMHAYISGMERGALSTFEEAPHHLRITATTTSADKYSRAVPTASHWNGNEADIAEALASAALGKPTSVPALVPRRIVLPERAEWDVAGFVERTLDFSGTDGGTDDEQDALVAAIDACGPVRSGTSSGQIPRVGGGEASEFHF